MATTKTNAGGDVHMEAVGKGEEEKSRAESPVAISTGAEESAVAAAGGGMKAKSPIKHIVEAEYSTSQEFFSVLARSKADGFAIQGKPEETPIWICNRTDKVVDVFQGLIKRNVSSVPVLLRDGKYYGFLDLMDIVRYVINHFGATSLTAGGEQKSFMDLVREEKTFQEKLVSDLMEYPYKTARPEHAFIPVKSGYSAMAVIEPLARERGLHRIPVITRERKIINLVTQSQALDFLHANHELLGAVNNKPLSMCKNAIKPVISVTEDSMAIDAFNLMLSSGVVGVAVCNSEGRLRGNLSLRDLKLCGADMALFWRLHQSVKNFVVKLRHEFQARHGRPVRAVYVLQSATLLDLIKTFHSERVHRVYICDSHTSKRPIGVMTLRDVLFEVINS